LPPITPIEPTIDDGSQKNLVAGAGDHVAAGRGDIFHERQYRQFLFRASLLIRKWIWRDCTGEPPGELITSATAFAFFIEKARSSVLATPASDIPAAAGSPHRSIRTGAPRVPRRSTAQTRRYPFHHPVGQARPTHAIACLFTHTLPLNHSLSRCCHWIEWNVFCIVVIQSLPMMPREKNMKIYLLMMLIGTLLTAIRFTSAPKQQSKNASQ